MVQKMLYRVSIGSFLRLEVPWGRRAGVRFVVRARLEQCALRPRFCSARSTHLVVLYLLEVHLQRSAYSKIVHFLWVHPLIEANYTHFRPSSFHTFTAASAPADAIFELPSIHATPLTPSLWAFLTSSQSPGLAKLQTKMLVSNDPLTTCVPALFQARDVMRAVCAVHRSVTRLPSATL